MVKEPVNTTKINGGGSASAYNLKLEETIFLSLKDLIHKLKAQNVAIENVTVFKKEKGKSSKWIELKKEQFAYRNKYYDVSKSDDGTGFYYRWEWEKKSPFDQSALPLKGLAVTAQDKPYVVDVIPTKTKWQKFKSFLNKLFN